MMSNFASNTGPSVLTARLQMATTNLAEIEQLVKSGEVDPRVLQDFRASVDLIPRNCLGGAAMDRFAGTVSRSVLIASRVVSTTRSASNTTGEKV